MRHRVDPAYVSVKVDVDVAVAVTAQVNVNAHAHVNVHSTSRTAANHETRTLTQIGDLDLRRLDACVDDAREAA